MCKQPRTTVTVSPASDWFQCTLTMRREDLSEMAIVSLGAKRGSGLCSAEGQKLYSGMLKTSSDTD